MAEESLTCARHGTATRLRCAECGTPICPECLVKTPVGLKCPDHAETVVPRISRRRRTGGLALAAVGLLAVIGGAMALVANLRDRSDRATSPAEAGPGLPPPDRIQTPHVAVMAPDGTGKRLLSNRPLAFDAAPAWSPDGSRIAFESLSDGRRSIWVMDATGERLRRLTDARGADSSPAWSPDGHLIAFMSDRDGDLEVYVTTADGSDVRRLTTQPGVDGYPTWSPDGGRIAFVSDRDGAPRVWTMAADGSGPVRFLDEPAVPHRPSFSPDGRRLAFTADRDGNPEIYVVNIDGTGLTRLTETARADGEAAFSPDGTRIAFASDRDGTPAVYVMAADGTGVRKLTTGPPAFTPAWSPDGRQLA
jgi:Tol biopolymer transport system component